MRKFPAKSQQWYVILYSNINNEFDRERDKKSRVINIDIDLLNIRILKLVIAEESTMRKRARCLPLPVASLRNRV